MRYAALTIQDKTRCEEFLKKSPHALSCYSFESIYIWKDLFEISYTVIEDALYIFFKDTSGVFLYLPPLGNTVSAPMLRAAFEALRALNTHQAVARIENIEEQDLPRYRGMGYTCTHKSDEYVCQSETLIELRGNHFKSKRAALNYFTKHYAYACREYAPHDAAACTALYEQWMQERREKSQDRFYCAMLEDSFKAFRVLVREYSQLGYKGAVVEVDGSIKGCTFGYPLREDTFCVAYEIADLSYKGIAQYMFREFCRAHTHYPFVNIMDDSELENLKKVKLSYHPFKTISSYIAKEA